MPLSRLYDFNSLGFEINIPIGSLQESFTLFSPYDMSMDRLFALLTNGIQLANGVGAGNGYVISNIYNVGKNFNKQILVSSFCSFRDEVTGYSDIFNLESRGFPKSSLGFLICL